MKIDRYNVHLTMFLEQPVIVLVKALGNFMRAAGKRPLVDWIYHLTH
jgi:hypothetical protein